MQPRSLVRGTGRGNQSAASIATQSHAMPKNATKAAPSITALPARRSHAQQLVRLWLRRVAWGVWRIVFMALPYQ